MLPGGRAAWNPLVGLQRLGRFPGQFIDERAELATEASGALQGDLDVLRVVRDRQPGLPVSDASVDRDQQLVGLDDINREVPPVLRTPLHDDRDCHRFAQVLAVGLEVLAGVIPVAPVRARLVQSLGTLNIRVAHETDSFPSARCRPASIEPSLTELGLRPAPASPMRTKDDASAVVADRMPEHRAGGSAFPGSEVGPDLRARRASPSHRPCRRRSLPHRA